MEPSFCLESLDKKSLDDIFDFQHDINKPVLYPSFDFHGDIEEEIYECIKADNLVYDAPNNVTFTNTAAVPINTIINKSIPQNEEAEPENSNIDQDKFENFNIISWDDSVNAVSEENKSHAISDNDSDDDLSKDDDYVGGLNGERKSKRTSKKIYAQNKKIHHVKVKRQEGVTIKRWNRKTDRDVFQYIKNQLKPTGMDIQEFIFDDTFKISDEKKRIILCKMRLKILEQAIKSTLVNNIDNQ